MQTSNLDCYRVGAVPKVEGSAKGCYLGYIYIYIELERTRVLACGIRGIFGYTNQCKGLTKAPPRDVLLGLCTMSLKEHGSWGTVSGASLV